MEFRKDINGLRAIAVLAVILFHFKVTGFNGGFTGVDIFFVISGYLMTGIIFTRIDNNKFSVIDFYLQRSRRIIPALAVLCIALAIFGFFFFMTNDLREMTQNIRKVILFISNYTFYKESGYFDTPSQENWLLHTWSLSVEWQFYLIYPLVIMGLSKFFNLKKIRFIVIAVAFISLVFSIIYTPTNPSFAFYSLPSRIWEMLAGGLVFLFPLSLPKHIKRLTEWAGLLVIILGLILLNDHFLWPSYLALIPIIGAMLVIWSNQGSIITTNVIFQWLGKISYSVYLWHWPIAVLLLMGGLLINPFFKIAGIFISLILGTLSYLFIEKQFKLTLSRTVEIIKYIAIVFITIAIAATIGSIAKHYPQLRMQSLQYLNEIVVQRYSPFTKRCLLAENAPPSPDCAIGNGEPSIIVLGDSHASVLFSTVAKVNNKGSSILWAFGGCPFIEGAKFTKPIYQGCTKFVPERLKLLESSYPNTRVLISNLFRPFLTDKVMSFDDKNKTFEQNLHSSYVKTICKIAETHPVYIVKPVPVYPYDIPKRMAIRRLFIFDQQPLTVPLSEYRKQHKIILTAMEAAAATCGVKLLDPTDYLCKNGVCYASIANQPLYFDDHHLTEFGATQLMPLFEEVFSDETDTPKNN